jgi:hypothetical protein
LKVAQACVAEAYVAEAAEAKEMGMKAILESVAARAANGWQRAGSKFDFEVFAMPGGSVMAPALWVYSVAVSLLRDSRQHS